MNPIFLDDLLTCAENLLRSQTDRVYLLEERNTISSAIDLSRLLFKTFKNEWVTSLLFSQLYAVWINLRDGPLAVRCDAASSD